MKITKLTVIKTPFEIPDDAPTYEEATIPALRTLSKEDQKKPIKITTKKFETRLFRNQGGREERFLVSVDDHGIIDSLLETTNNDIDRIVNQKIEKKSPLVQPNPFDRLKILSDDLGKAMHETLIQAGERERIGRLSWYRRLLKRF